MMDYLCMNEQFYCYAHTARGHPGRHADGFVTKICLSSFILCMRIKM